ncbi:MAG: hypothetical protein GF344_16045, partial [Chitinivibrionales bacterium]|nr:hypothetical protein [Chitinivibrionales bacterium]MBD3358207.1 hypothetical protein [Chitinivibrionales bacterium]
MKTSSSILLLLFASLSIAQTVSLLPNAADFKDDCWTVRTFPGVSKETFGIKGTGTSLNGFVTWDSFSGSTGNYKMELQAVLESDGDSPYKLYIEGTEVASGRYPYADGSKDCNGNTYKVVWLDLGTHTIAEGNRIRYWAKSVYPCGSSHGQYSRFQEIRFTRVTQDATPPSPPENLVEIGTTNRSISLSWSASSDPESGISRYEVYIGETLKVTVSGEATSADITGLERNTGYTNIRVTAVNGAGLESEGGESITAHTANNPAPDGTIFIRAADGKLSNGMTMAYSNNVPGALGGNSLYGKNGTISGPSSDDSKVTYTIVIPDGNEGSYYAWFRGRYSFDGGNSFWMSVDDGAAQRILNGANTNGWHWEGHMADGAVDIGNLSAGRHTITITVREPANDNLLDVICLSRSSDYLPT